MIHTLPKMIGVIHLPPLPGSPGASKLSPRVASERAEAWALQEAKILSQCGFDGIILENFGDAPFYKTEVKPETIASLAIISNSIRAATKVKLGINVLRNDAYAALGIAAVVGADFIRINVISGVVATDQGLIEGNAADLIRERIRLNAEHVGILADVHVKHAQTLSSSSIAIAIEETAGRGGADGVIITGSTTGRAPALLELNEAIRAAHEVRVPLYIGSGLKPDSIKELHPSVRFIVGSALRKNGKAGSAMDIKRVKEFMKAARSK